MFPSILDNDLYSFTQQQIIWSQYSNVPVEYQFINRNSRDLFSADCADKLRGKIEEFNQLQLADQELYYLNSLRLFNKEYLNYLKNFRFQPDQIRVNVENHQLKLSIKGPWHETILWEVPLLALISETFFSGWGPLKQYLLGQQAWALYKVKYLDSYDLSFCEFGTRRRRHSEIQKRVVETLSISKNFMGTSNVYLAMKLGLNPIGTMSHQWIMGNSALYGLENVHKRSFFDWMKFYQHQAGAALTDTYGTSAFFRDFDWVLARLYDGLRWDSGNATDFTIKVIKHYEKLGIDPSTKTIYYSDGLTPEKCREIQLDLMEKVCPPINKVFCIGTNFSNDIPGEPPLNIVIKMTKCNNKNVVKLSDVPGKATGDPETIKSTEKFFAD